MSGLEERRIVAILEALPKAIKEKTMNTLEIFIEKGKKMGREEGRAEGRVEGLQQGINEGLAKGKREKAQEVVRNLIRVSALSDEQIAAVAEVSVAYVAQMRNDMKAVD